MEHKLKRAAERAAHAADELMGFLAALAAEQCDVAGYSTAYWEVIHPAICIREDLVRLLTGFPGLKTRSVIHCPALVDPALESDHPFDQPADVRLVASTTDN
jgi:hypothetical protein